MNTMKSIRPVVQPVTPPGREKHYIIIRRVPQLEGDPECAVVEDGGGRADVVALFYADRRAVEYIELMTKGKA